MKEASVQFGLRTVLLATSAAAVLACMAVPGDRQINRVMAFGGIAALSTAAVLAAAVLIAFGFSLAMLVYHAVRPACDWIRTLLQHRWRLP